MKKIVITVVAVLAALLLGFGIFAWNAFSYFKKIKALPTGEVAPGIYAVNNKMVNFYLLKGAKDIVAIDAGMYPSISLKELTGLGIDFSKVVAVFLTHTDRDHTAGIGLFPNALTFLSSAEEQLVNGTVKRSPFFKNDLIVARAFIEDGLVTNIAGFTIEAIATPGHTVGSLSYLVNGKYLFTGDTLFLKDGKVVPVISLINMDTEQEKRSIRKLAKLEGVEKVFTAHSGSTGDFETAFKDWK